MKRNLILGLVTLSLLAAACGGGGGGATTAQGPSKVLSGAVAAAKTAGTVHFKLLGKESGKTETIVLDASSADGHEIITAGDVTIQVEVVGGKAFIEGNETGLEDQIGLSATDAATYAGKWISIASTDAPYASVTKAVTLASTLTQIEPSSHLVLTADTTRQGHAVTGVTGGLPGTAVKGTTGGATLYVSTAHPTLPVTFEAHETSAGVKETDVGTFTQWGKKLHLAVPTAAVAFSSLPMAAPATTTPSG